MSAGEVVAAYVALFAVCFVASFVIANVVHNRRARARARDEHVDRLTDPAGATYVDRAVAAAVERRQTAETPAAPEPLPVWPPICKCGKPLVGGIAHVCRRSAS